MRWKNILLSGILNITEEVSGIGQLKKQKHPKTYFLEPDSCICNLIDKIGEKELISGLDGDWKLQALHRFKEYLLYLF